MVDQIYYDVWLNDKEKIRIFKENIQEEFLVWHRDKRNRKIEVLFGSNWKFQFDNEMPFTLEVGKTYEVRNMRYHRILKGDGHLIVKISEE